jgi:uncharacterized protein
MRSVPSLDSVAEALRTTEVDGILSAYVFGSVAEGREHAESDVDIGVLLDRAVWPGEKERFDAKLLLTARLSREPAGPAADVVILNDAPPLLGRRIITEGVRVLCEDTEKDRAYQRDVQLLAADIEPWLRRMQRIKLEALERR